MTKIINQKKMITAVVFLLIRILDEFIYLNI
jgi:hypothetical protein